MLCVKRFGIKKTEMFSIHLPAKQFISVKKRSLEKPNRSPWHVRVDPLGEPYLQHAYINTSTHVTTDHIYSLLGLLCDVETATINK